MVLHKYGELLYSGLKKTLTEQLRRIADNQVGVAQGEGFLMDLKRRWDLHSKSIQMVRDILMVNSEGEIRGCCCSCHVPQLDGGALS